MGLEDSVFIYIYRLFQLPESFQFSGFGFPYRATVNVSAFGSNFSWICPDGYSLPGIVEW
jgi:hypothetical protein